MSAQLTYIARPPGPPLPSLFHFLFFLLSLTTGGRTNQGKTFQIFTHLISIITIIDPKIRAAHLHLHLLHHGGGMEIFILYNEMLVQKGLRETTSFLGAGRRVGVEG